MHEDLNICKFLVENGADVESIEKVLDGDSMVYVFIRKQTTTNI